MLVVNPSVPAQSLKEFVAYAKANPGKLSYSSAGVGSASHVAAELLKREAGIQMVHVPNKGMNPALIDLMGGQVQVLFASVPGLTSEKTERARPIAVAELKRSALMPELPTMSESGLSGFAVGNWAGLLGPAGLDAAIVKKLHDEVIAILATDEMKARIKTLGYDVIESSPEQFAAELSADVARWGPVAKAAADRRSRSIDAVERRGVLDQHALDVLPGGAKQEGRGLAGDAADMRREQQPGCGPRRSSANSGLSAAGGSVA